MSILSSLKKLIVPAGRQWRTIRVGPASGIRMQLDLRDQSQRYFGLDEKELFKPLRKLMPGCLSMVDVGANDGYYTLIFLRAGARRVVACEPSDAVDRLLQNAQANGFEPGEKFQIVPRLVGLGEDKAGLADIVHDLPGPILIKLDVEGAELEVLQSCETFARLQDLHWIVETHSAELEEQCMRWFESHGFSCEIIPNAWWRCLLPETRHVAHNRWIVAVPKASEK